MLPHAIHKIQVKQINIFSIRSENVKLVGEMFIDIGLSNNLLDMMPKLQGTKAKMGKWDYIRLKSSAQKEKQSIEHKDNLVKGRKYLSTMYMMRGKFQDTSKTPSTQ